MTNSRPALRPILSLLPLLAALSGSPAAARADELSRWQGLWHQASAVPLRLEQGCATDVRVLWQTAEYLEHQCRTGDGRWRQQRLALEGPDAEGRLHWRRAGGLASPLEVIAADEAGAWLLLGDGQRRWAWVLTRAQRPAPDDVDTALARADAAGYPRAAWRALPSYGRTPADPVPR